MYLFTFAYEGEKDIFWEIHLVAWNVRVFELERGENTGLIRVYVVREMENVGRAIDPLIIPRISRERTRELDRVARVYTGFERYYGVGRGQDTLYESFRYFCILMYFPRTLAYTRNNK